MIATQTTAPSGSIDTPEGSFLVGAWIVFAGQLNDLLCGAHELEAAGEVIFQDTVPAVCWAVPGAYASSIDPATANGSASIAGGV